MSTPINGLQFPILPHQEKPSSSKLGRAIVAAALSYVDETAAKQTKSEKNWRKQYPAHFKNLVRAGLMSSEAALHIAQDGLNHAHEQFEFYREGQKYALKDVMSLDAEKLETFTLQGSSTSAPEWYVPYHGQKLQGDALLQQIQKWQDRKSVV